LGHKNNQGNYYRKPTKKKGNHPSGFKRIFIKATAGLGVLCLLSIGFIFIYDLIIQCDSFEVKNLTITGNQMFSGKQIINLADLKKGTNLFSVNLSLVEKRLLAHSWIEEAEISRDLPSAIKIKIKEHKAVAIVDFGRRFLINNKGEIFKEWSPGDPDVLPVISGLRYSDISIIPNLRSHGSSESDKALYMKKRNNPFTAVLDVLRLGQMAESVLPNKLIREIMVDREIGITIHAFKKIKEIKLGYENYADKYILLKKALLYIKNKNKLQNPVSIDLNNFNRIVVNLSN
jgi:cell division protein FtsQ